MDLMIGLDDYNALNVKNRCPTSVYTSVNERKIMDILEERCA
jgi:hypothetical protein